MPSYTRRGHHKALETKDCSHAIALTLGTDDDRSASLIFGKMGELPGARRSSDSLFQQKRQVSRHRSSTSSVTKTGRFTTWWKLCDPRHPDRDYVGLNRILNRNRGVHRVDLAPGSYRLWCNVPKDLNHNVINNKIIGGVVGNVKGAILNTRVSSERTLRKRGKSATHAISKAMGRSRNSSKTGESKLRSAKSSHAIRSKDRKKGYVKEGVGKNHKVQVVKERGLPSNYVEVLTKIYTEGSESDPFIKFTDCLDRGLCSDVVREFVVEEDCKLLIKFRSHSFFKRMKIQAVLQREDPDAYEKMLLSPKSQQRSDRASKGKALFLKVSGGNSFEFTGTVVAMLTAFYQKYCPEKVDAAESVVAHFEGRINTLLTTLEAKYDVTIVFKQTKGAHPE